MEKPNFEYQTLEQALENGKVERDRFEKLNPEGVGPETKKVMQEVYDRRAQFGENEVKFEWDYDRCSKGWAVSKASDKVKRQGLEDGAYLGDVYIYAAVEEAQFKAYNIAAARELVEAEDLDDVQCETCNMGMFYVGYLRADKKSPSPLRYELILGSRAKRIFDAVIKDMGLTQFISLTITLP